MSLRIWRTPQPDFPALLDELEVRRGAAQGFDADVRRRVQEILEAVRTRGDEAVLEFTERFDGCRLEPENMRVGPEEVEEALASIPGALLDALKYAAERIRTFQESILLRDPAPIETGGRSLGIRYRPVDSAGLCVPGFTASLASSVLMNAVPAAVAGVGRIVMITPPRPRGGSCPSASVSPDRLAAAHVAGIEEIYRVFGVQGVAALAYGTETIPVVDFIAGPGNVYVQSAKKAVFGVVGVDMIAGHSEVLVLADFTAKPEWVAAELISQSEHHEGCATLLTDDEQLAEATAQRVDEQLAAHSGAREVRDHLECSGLAVVAGSMDECVELANRLAPEHLVIMTREPEALSEGIRHAGAIFLGDRTPVAVGDYVAGPSHCLPTGTTARFSSGLTANTFLKSTSLVRYDRKALAEDAASLEVIAEAEGLEAHARSVELRLQPRGDETGKEGASRTNDKRSTSS